MVTNCAMIKSYLGLLIKMLLIMNFIMFIYGTDLYAQDSIRIYGHVTDFNGHPLDSVSVLIKNKNFENLYETLTDKNGYFSVMVPKGFYYCLYAIKSSDYGKTKLEYWAWNIPAYKDLNINPKYDRMEIYGLNAFEPQVGPFETYMVYFRPMSLTKALEIMGNIQMKDTIDVAPKNITKDELVVYVNDLLSEVININKVTEYARGKFVYGFLIQIKKPRADEGSELEYDKISVILHSKETNEYGMGECFVKKFLMR